MYLVSVGMCLSPALCDRDTLVNTVGVAMGIVYIYQEVQVYTFTVIRFTTAYYSVSLSLNVLLTLMIVARLIMHRRNLRKAIGASDGASGLYTTIVTMLIESCALYTAVFLLYLVPWAVNSWVLVLFSKAVHVAQVRAVSTFLRRAATSGHCCPHRSLLLI